MRTYQEIVTECVEIGIAHSKALAREGIGAPLRLYYKTGALALASEAAAFPMGSEWTATEYFLNPSVPYAGYEAWVRRHAGNLPLFLGGAQ